MNCHPEVKVEKSIEEELPQEVFIDLRSDDDRCVLRKKENLEKWLPFERKYSCYPLWKHIAMKFNTYIRVVTTNGLKAPRHLVVHDNLNTFTKYSESSLQPL